MVETSLFPYMHDDLSVVGVGAVFPEVDALPGAEGESVVHDGDGECGGGEGGLDVGRHVVGAFGGVGVERVVFGDEATHPLLEVAAGGGVGVLLNREAGGGVSDEEGAESVVDIG